MNNDASPSLSPISTPANAHSPALLNAHTTALPPATKTFHFPIIDARGERTSVSIPAALMATYVDAFGSRTAFRIVLNDVSRQVTPKVGYSRSQLVRIELDARALRQAHALAQASAAGS